MWELLFNVPLKHGSVLTKAITPGHVDNQTLTFPPVPLCLSRIVSSSLIQTTVSAAEDESRAACWFLFPARSSIKLSQLRGVLFCLVTHDY